MKEFLGNLENFARKVFHSLKTFRPLGLELTMKNLAKLAFLVGAGWLICKALGHFLMIWRICKTVEIVAGLIVG